MKPMSKKALLFVIPLVFFLCSCSNDYSNDFDSYWIEDGTSAIEEFNEQLEALILERESNEFYSGKQGDFHMFKFQDFETSSGLIFHGEFGFSLENNGEINKLIFNEFYLNEYLLNGIGSELYILNEELVLLE
ncbi:MAG: hypothetical protein ACPGRE_00475 [Flavobacteriaceae bacterium]